ncbi:hypothetical protein KIN20_006479 [Parelaphostrongylus tenuis]|uniref:Uncharacterized protein n=1 Tax=Parelaphostrongylus tenuis TaxID=148309 RepID=A0AAD5M664_PARTN|nr:hypothetical protein KIN20_006479 [Parelaphostrongylus tenuis]
MDHADAEVPRQSTVEYGPEWYIDYPSHRYSWSHSHFNVKPNGKWSKEELNDVYQVYYSEFLSSLSAPFHSFRKFMALF